jgi:hypothetical protein
VRWFFRALSEEGFGSSCSDGYYPGIPERLSFFRLVMYRDQSSWPILAQYVKDVVASLEADPVVATRAAAFAGLRRLGIDDFGEFLLSMPNLTFPKLSRLLPAMASDEVQRNWTGNCGIDLLKQTTSFVRAVSYSFARLSGRSLDQASVLDFGCGYGRIARLFYYFTDEDRFCGVDPWDRSIELCRESGLVKNFHVSDVTPQSQWRWALAVSVFL